MVHRRHCCRRGNSDDYCGCFNLFVGEMMKPIKRGMTEAVTRDGRKVTQLTWFDLEKDIFCVRGVFNGQIASWTASGRYFSSGEESAADIFAPVEYEWQFLLHDTESGLYETSFYAKSEEDALSMLSDRYVVISRIEESKREVK